MALAQNTISGRAGEALQPRTRRAVLSLAPLIDVTFLLLIFFMLVTQFDRLAAIEVSVATAPPLEVRPRKSLDGGVQARARLTLHAGGAMRLDGRALAGIGALPAALEALAARYPRGEEGEPPVLIAAPDGDVTLQTLISVLAALETQPWFDFRLESRSGFTNGARQ